MSYAPSHLLDTNAHMKKIFSAKLSENSQMTVPTLDAYKKHEKSRTIY